MAAIIVNGWANPTGLGIRNDSGGSGRYGASRSRAGGIHYGVDYSGVSGQDVYAPITGTITATKPSRTSKLHGFNMVSDDRLTTVTVLYAKIAPSLQGKHVTVGQVVAVQEDLQTANEYPANVGDHVHVQIRRNRLRVNPETVIPLP
jgi:murein DD-endopeptidase MepM/ murein hydrolase activator NlpD